VAHTDRVTQSPQQFVVSISHWMFHEQPPTQPQ
jgi:hypothetical protein